MENNIRSAKKLHVCAGSIIVVMLVAIALITLMMPLILQKSSYRRKIAISIFHHEQALSVAESLLYYGIAQYATQKSVSEIDFGNLAPEEAPVHYGHLSITQIDENSAMIRAKVFIGDSDQHKRSVEGSCLARRAGDGNIGVSEWQLHISRPNSA